MVRTRSGRSTQDRVNRLEMISDDIMTLILGMLDLGSAMVGRGVNRFFAAILQQLLSLPDRQWHTRRVCTHPDVSKTRHIIMEENDYIPEDDEASRNDEGLPTNAAKLCLFPTWAFEPILSKTLISGLRSKHYISYACARLRYGGRGLGGRNGVLADDEAQIVSLNGLHGSVLSPQSITELKKSMQLLCREDGVMLMCTRNLPSVNELGWVGNDESGWFQSSPFDGDMLQERVELGRFDQRSAALPLRSRYAAECAWAAHELRFVAPGIEFSAFGKTMTTRLGDIEVTRRHGGSDCHWCLLRASTEPSPYPDDPHNTVWPVELVNFVDRDVASGSMAAYSAWLADDGNDEWGLAPA